MMPRIGLFLLIAAGLVATSCENSPNPVNDSEGTPVRLQLVAGSDLPDSILRMADSIVLELSGTDGNDRIHTWRPGKDSSPRLRFPVDVGFDVRITGYDSSEHEIWRATTSIASVEDGGVGDSLIVMVAHPPPATTTTGSNDPVPPPLIFPGGGVFHQPVRVAVSSYAKGAELHYTIDGSDPTRSSRAIDTVLTIRSSCTLKAIAFSSGRLPSAISKADFKLVADTLIAGPIQSQLERPTWIAMHCTSPGATIRYRLDGTNPDSTSSVLKDSLLLALPTVRLRARAFAPGLEPGRLLSVDAQIDYRAPHITALSTPLDTTQVLSLEHAFPTARVHYTLDGSRPDTNSPIAGKSLALSRNTRVRATAWIPGFGASPELDTSIVMTAHTPDFRYESGSFDRPLLVLAPPLLPWAVRYATGGEKVTDSSPIVPDSLWIRSSTTISVKGIREGWNSGNAITGTWTLAVRPLTLSTQPGLIYKSGRLFVGCSTEVARIVHTRDGSLPDSGSPSSDGGILLDSASTSGGLTLKFLAYIAGEPGITTSSRSGTWTWAGGSIVDPRDSQHYRTIRVDQSEWLAEDLRRDDGDTPFCFPGSVGGCPKGRFYLEPAANCDSTECAPPQGPCPDGWRIPTVSEWERMSNLITAMDGGSWDVSALVLGVGSINPKGQQSSLYNGEHWAWDGSQMTHSSETQGFPANGYRLPIRCIR